MADEIEIMKNERAAAPDGAEWMTGPPAGVQVDDFVCGLQRGGVKLWIDNDGLFLGHAGVVVCIDHHELCVIAHGDAILAPHDDRDPLGLVDPGIALLDRVSAGDREARHRASILGVANLGILPEVADEVALVDALAHASPRLCFSSLYSSGPAIIPAGPTLRRRRPWYR